MTTAYTSLLGLALPVTGELSGTWGDTVNNGITSLLDSAISGTTTLSADSDVTLTTTQGSSNTAREAILLWTAGGTATRTITAPAQSKIYTVINASSGTQSIILAGAGPTSGVTIAKGESALCAWNGSDFIKISNTAGPGTFTNLTVTGNTSLGDADTDTITQAASYVTGTQLKSAKTATNTLSLAAYDVDGAAYTNLITLTASNTPTLALTSTGVGTINNMSIGATTASTGAFTTLTSNGATTFTAGTASTTTGTGTLVITGGLGVSGRINAVNFDGIVGANTAAAGSFTTLSASLNTSALPAGPTGTILQIGQADGVASNITIDQFGGITGGIMFRRTTGTNAAKTATNLATQASIGFMGYGATGYSASSRASVSWRTTEAWTDSAQGCSILISATPTGSTTTAVVLTISGSELAVTGALSATGNVTGPTLQLGTNPAGVSIGVLGIPNQKRIYGRNAANSADVNILYVNGSNGLVLGPSDAAVIDSSGNLGIGSTSPDQKLVVRDVNKIVDGIGNVFFATTDSQAADLGASLSLGGTYVGTSAYSFAAIAGRKTNSTSTDASGYLAMYTTNPSNTIVERARITSGGDFYLGPLATNFTFTNGSAVSLAGSGTGIAGNGTNLTLGAWNGPIIFQVGNSAGALVERARIDTSGNLLVGSTNSSGTIGAGFKVLGGRPVVVNADSANATTVYEAYSTGASAYRFYVGMGGTIYATSTTITPITSDERLKQNIVDYSNGLSQVLGLRPRYFEYKKEPGRKLAGFISQEVQTVMPEAIVPTLEDPEMMTYSIDWYPLFVKAIQEQQALITQLTARITALESA